MNRVSFLAVLSLLLSVVPAAANPEINDLTMTAFLQTAEKDTAVENHSELVTFSENIGSDTPYIQRVEAITETNEFDLGKQLYALRFYPRGWGETKKGKEKNAIEKTIIRLDGDIKFNRAVRERYDLINEYLDVFSQIESYSRLKNLYKEQIEGIDKAVDFEKYLTMDEKIADVSFQLADLHSRKTELIGKIHIAARSKANIYFHRETLTSYELMNEVAGKVVEQEGINNIDLARSRNHVDRHEKNYEVKKAENTPLISYIQGEFNSDKAEDIDKAYSLKVAVNLPFIKTGNGRIQGLKETYIRKKLDYFNQRKALSDRIKQLSGDMQKYHRQSKMMKEKLASRKAFLESGSLSGKNRFLVQEQLITTEQVINRLAVNIRKTFIEMVDLGGALSAAPLKNYLVTN